MVKTVSFIVMAITFYYTASGVIRAYKEVV